MSGWPGVGRARRAAALLDPRSESVGESLSRVLLVEAGLAPTDLQLPVVGADGDLVGRVDFAWPEHRTIGEFDGRVKYGRGSQDGSAERDKRGWEDVVWGGEDPRGPPARPGVVRGPVDLGRPVAAGAGRHPRPARVRAGPALTHPIDDRGTPGQGCLGRRSGASLGQRAAEPST